MAKPVLIINGHDYAAYVQDLNISRNDLDADGSGRDVQTGLMYRTRIATKLKADVKLFDIPESVHKALLADISPVFYSATVLDPNTGAQVTKTFYTSTVPFGAQRYDKRSGAPRYSGMTFNMTER
ncbi:MAG: hypothetical protein II008_18305 [Oscillospiraceae bacterium]|nr:hypothetical protein [Oscillospiraceae bacterium]